MQIILRTLRWALRAMGMTGSQIAGVPDGLHCGREE